METCLFEPTELRNPLIMLETRGQTRSTFLQRQIMSSSLGFVHPRPFVDLSRSTGDYVVATRQLQTTSRPAPVVDLQVLQNASRVLQDQFLKDSQIIPDLGDTLTTGM